MFPQKCFHPVVILILHCNINKTRAIPCCIANFFHPYYLFMSHPLLSLSLFTIYFILSFLIILNSKLSLFLSSYLQDPSSNKYKQKILLQFSSVFLPVIFRLNYLCTTNISVTFGWENNCVHPWWKVPGGFQRFLLVFGRLLEVPWGSWRFLKVPGGFWRFLELPGNSWRFLEFPRGFWRLQEVPDFFFLLSFLLK